MVAQATVNYPTLRFQVRDVCELAYREEFDGVFSNAVLHWSVGQDGILRRL
jgi:trans-aconitate methyltransferase